jgi:hypothetical protein
VYLTLKAKQPVRCLFKSAGRWWRVPKPFRTSDGSKLNSLDNLCRGAGDTLGIVEASTLAKLMKRRVDLERYRMYTRSFLLFELEYVS